MRQTSWPLRREALAVCDRDADALDSITSWAHKKGVVMIPIEGDGRDPGSNRACLRLGTSYQDHAIVGLLIRYSLFHHTGEPL